MRSHVIRTLAGILLVIAPLTGLAAACTSPVGSSQQGPFKATCIILDRGVATIHFTNSGGRQQVLHSFWITLQSGKGRHLKTRHIQLATPAKVPPSSALSSGTLKQTEGVTYRAARCGIAHVR